MKPLLYPDVRPCEMLWYSVETPHGLEEFCLPKYVRHMAQSDRSAYMKLHNLAHVHGTKLQVSDRPQKYDGAHD